MSGCANRYWGKKKKLVLGKKITWEKNGTKIKYSGRSSIEDGIELA